MSAFIVGTQTMHRVLAGYTLARGEVGQQWSCEQLDAKGRELFALNAKAITLRYPGDHEYCRGAEEYSYRPNNPTRIQALKSVKCLIYQCSEGNIPETSTLYKELENVAERLAWQVIHALPEYESADWDKA